MKMRLAIAAMLVVIGASTLGAQNPLDGVWQGYDGEWRHTSNQLIALA